MHNYILSCCSTVDLTAKHLQERNISWLPFHFFLDEKEYFDDMFTKTMTPEDFYTAMAKGAMTRTSQVNATEYYDYFEKFVKEGKAIVHATLSSGLSGSYNSANTAVSMLKEKYPTCEIYVIDTLCASSGFGLFVDMLADARDKGMSAKELYEYGENLKLHIHLDFYSTDLTYYVRGGRVSKAAGLIGGILKICPVLDMNNEGKLIVRKKARGKIKAAEELLGQMLSCAEHGRDYDGKCFISQSNFTEEAQRLALMIENEFERLKGKIKIFPIGPTIGSHTGGGTIALFYVGKERGE